MYCHLIASCTVCRKPVDAANDCWRSGVWDTSTVHVLCLAAAIIIGECPSLLDHEIADRVNEQAADLSEALCQNPHHVTSHDRGN